MILARFYRLIFSLLPILLLIGEPARSQTVLENIQQTGLMKVGIREDAVPFGFRDANGDLSGLCLDFVAILLREVKQTLNREALLVKIFHSTLYDRYELVSNRTIHIECGPNSITPQKLDNVAFSRPFFTTGTQFLIATDQKKQFKLQGDLSGQVIGVLRNTSNQTFLKERYPQATFRVFQGPTGRLRGVQALRQGKITAFASDGILLIGEAIIQGLLVGTTYETVPAIPLDCSRYGMILPDGDSQWLEMVNKAIATARKEKVFREWIGVVLPEIRDVRTYCRNLNRKLESPVPPPQ